MAPDHPLGSAPVTRWLAPALCSAVCAVLTVVCLFAWFTTAQEASQCASGASLVNAGCGTAESIHTMTGWAALLLLVGAIWLFVLALRRA